MNEQEHIEDLAKQFVGNWKSFDSFGWRARPEDDDNMTIVYTHHRDSNLLALSNAEVIKKALQPYIGLLKDGDDVQEEHHGHWGCGWVDGFAIRVYHDGKVTLAFAEYAKLFMQMEEYACLDEVDYYRRVYEQTIQNIHTEGYSLVIDGAEGWEEKVYEWLSENEPDSVEDEDSNGAYPSKELIAEALENLGLHVKEQDY